MLIKIVNYIIFAVIAVFFLIGVLEILRSLKKMTKSEAKEQIKSAGFLKLSAILLAFILTVVYCGNLMIITSTAGEAVITLNYAEASFGLNANKTRYNMDEIICDDVIERMIVKGGFTGVTVSDFDGCFTVTPLIEGDSYDEDLYHISTEYVIEYSAPDEMTDYPAETVLSLLCESYREHYFDKYFADFELENDFESEYAYLDYYDMVTYLSTKSTEILNYLYGLQRKSSSFVSSTGATFSSVAARTYSIMDSQIATDLYSFILQNGLSKDAGNYIDRLTFDNNQSGFDKEKSQTNYDVTNRAVSKYAEQMATAVLVPTRDDKGEYYMGRTKVGVDELSLQASEYAAEVADFAKEIETNSLRIKYLREAAGNTENNRAEADRLINQIYNSLLKFAAEARSIGREYYATQMNQCISATVSPSSILSMWKSILAVFLCSYIALVAYSTGKSMKRYGKEGE